MPTAKAASPEKQLDGFIAKFTPELAAFHLETAAVLDRPEVRALIQVAPSARRRP